MNRLLTLALGLTLCLSLASCVPESTQPLSSPASAKPDAKLVGTWHEEKVDDETLVFTIKDAHWMHLEDRKEGKSTGSYDLFVTVIDGNRFLNVRPLGNEEDQHGYYIVRYEVSSRTLSTWWLDQDKAVAAIRAGKLKGTVHEEKGSTIPGQTSYPDVSVTLQDSSANLAGFIHSEGAKALFSDRASKLVRVETASH